MPHTPYISVVESPNQVQVQSGDYIKISLISITHSIIIGENNDTTFVTDTSAISQEVWQITSPIILNNPIEDKTICEYDTIRWLNYNISSYIFDGHAPISWKEFLGPSYMSFNELRVILSFFDLSFYEGYYYHVSSNE